MGLLKKKNTKEKAGGGGEIWGRGRGRGGAGRGRPIGAIATLLTRFVELT